VWVIEIDRERRRVSLTAIDPSIPSEKPQPTERKPKRDARPERPARKKERPEGKPPAGRGGSGGGKPRAGKPPRRNERRAKPKPSKPITDGMKEGKEPLRSFGDLQQFFDMQKKDKKKGKGD